MEMFLGFPLVCNEFTTCTGHQPCRLYRNRNHTHYGASEKTDAKKMKEWRAKKKAGFD